MFVYISNTVLFDSYVEYMVNQMKDWAFKHHQVAELVLLGNWKFVETFSL